MTIKEPELFNVETATAQELREVIKAEEEFRKEHIETGSRTHAGMLAWQLTMLDALREREGNPTLELADVLSAA